MLSCDHSVEARNTNRLNQHLAVPLFGSKEIALSQNTTAVARLLYESVNDFIKIDDRFLQAAILAFSQPMYGIPTRLSQITSWTEKIDNLSKLAPGWNRQGAAAPNEGAIRAAQQFVEALVNDEQPPTRVAASAVGGVGVTRKAGERLAYIEFYNDGTACALFTDDTAADELVLDVEPEQGTFRTLSNKMKVYLNG